MYFYKLFICFCYIYQSLYGSKLFISFYCDALNSVFIVVHLYYEFIIIHDFFSKKKCLMVSNHDIKNSANICPYIYMMTITWDP